MRCIPRFALRALASLFGIGSAWACTQPLSNTFWWANCVDVNVYLDSSLSTLPVGPGDSPATQIASAVATWSTSIPPLYPFVSINVETTGDPDWTATFQAGRPLLREIFPLMPSSEAQPPQRKLGQVARRRSRL